MDSKQPRKQRKAHFGAAMHERQKKVAAPLSKELREKHKKRSMAVRKGDTVKVVRGQYKGITEKVMEVDLKRYRIFVKGAERKNAKGKESPYPIHPSNVMITELSLDDELRKSKLKG